MLYQYQIQLQLYTLLQTSPLFISDFVNLQVSCVSDDPDLYVQHVSQCKMQLSSPPPNVGGQISKLNPPCMKEVSQDKGL